MRLYRARQPFLSCTWRREPVHARLPKPWKVNNKAKIQLEKSKAGEAAAGRSAAAWCAEAERKEGIAIRKAIKKRLEEKIPELTGRVRDLPIGGQSYADFGAVVTFGEEIRKNDWIGYRRIIKVWPYADEASGGFEKIEELAGRIEAALHEAVLESEPEAGVANADGTSSFACVYLGSADGDRADALFGGMTRGLRFAVYRQSAGTASDSGEAGTELTALAELTSELLGSDWHVTADRWPAAIERPCVLWRLSASRKVTAKPSAFDVRRTYAAHVLGRGPAEERETLERLTVRLSGAQRLKASEPGRRGATIADVVADLEVDGFQKGQLRLDVLERAAAASAHPGETDPLVRIGYVGLKQAD